MYDIRSVELEEKKFCQEIYFEQFQERNTLFPVQIIFIYYGTCRPRKHKL